MNNAEMKDKKLLTHKEFFLHFHQRFYFILQVHHLAFLKFHKGIEKMRDYIQNTKKHLYLSGVLQASKVRYTLPYYI